MTRGRLFFQKPGGLRPPWMRRLAHGNGGRRGGGDARAARGGMADYRPGRGYERGLRNAETRRRNGRGGGDPRSGQNRPAAGFDVWRAAGLTPPAVCACAAAPEEAAKRGVPSRSLEVSGFRLFASVLILPAFVAETSECGFLCKIFRSESGKRLENRRKFFRRSKLRPQFFGESLGCCRAPFPSAPDGAAGEVCPRANFRAGLK